jgi:hypothetical protein
MPQWRETKHHRSLGIILLKITGNGQDFGVLDIVHISPLFSFAFGVSGDYAIRCILKRAARLLWLAYCTVVLSHESYMSSTSLFRLYFQS